MTSDRQVSQRPLLVLCGLVLVVDTMFFTALTPLLPYYAGRFDLSVGEVGLLAGAYPAGGAVSALPAGFVTTRVGVKPSLLFGLGVMVASSACLGIAATGWELVLIRFVQGIGSTVSWIAALAWLLTRVSPQRRGETIGHGYGVSMVGSLVGPAVAPAVPEVGPGLTFGAISVLFAILFVAFCSIPAPTATVVRRRVGLRILVRTPGVGAGFWLLTLQAVVFGALSVLGPLRLAELGYTVVAISVVYLVTGGLAIGVSPIAGRWSDRRGRLEPMKYALGGATLAVGTLPLFARAWEFALALVVASLILFLLSAPASTVVADAVDARDLGFALGWAVILLAWGPGSVVGAIGAGWLTQATVDFVPYLLLSASCAAALIALSRGGLPGTLLSSLASGPRSSVRTPPASRRPPGQSRR